MKAEEILGGLLTPQGRDNPYPLYTAAHAIGPVAPMEGGPFLVSGYDAVNQILRSPSFLVADLEMQESWGFEPQRNPSTEWVTRSILQNNEPHHSRVRSLISSVFTPRRVAALEPAIAAAVDRLLDELAELGAGGASVDFMEHFAYRLPVTVICELLGVPEDDRQQFRALAADLTVVLEFNIEMPDLTAADAAGTRLRDYFAALAAARRAEPRDDLVSALVQARDADDGRLSDIELIANLVLLLVAGFETTTNLLGNGLALLFEHRDVRDGVESGEVPVAGFVEEVLRFDSPVQATSRQSRGEGLTVAGVSIPNERETVLLLGAANRDPARYPEPDRFDPMRKDSNPISFGAGAHYCLGAVLARTEAALVFPRLLERFPALAPAPGVNPVRRDRLILRGYESLPITVG